MQRQIMVGGVWEYLQSQIRLGQFELRLSTFVNAPSPISDLRLSAFMNAFKQSKKS